MADEAREVPKGLVDLRQMIARGARRGMAETLRFAIVEADEGSAVIEGKPGPHAYNPYGTIHGGYAAALLDSACGLAVHSRLGEGQALATLEIKISFHRPMTGETGAVRAIGRVVSMGGRIAFSEARLVDTGENLIATATATLTIIGSG